MQLFKSCAGGSSVASACQAAIERLHEEGHTFAHTNLILAIGEALKALSLALIATIIVTNTIEERNRERLNDALARKARQISHNVFEGLFGNRHPAAALDTLKGILSRPLLRSRLDVTYTFFIYEGEPNTRIAGRKYVKVETLFSATTRNIANPDISPTASDTLPIALSLPNPLIEELKPFVVVSKVVVNGDAITQEKLDTANEELQRQLGDDTLADGYVHVDDLTLTPGQEVRIEAQYTMMKEFEDTEVFRSFYLTEMLTLTVVDKSGEDFAIRARAIHPGHLRDTGSTKSVLKWELSEIILPQQGIMVWWKKPLDSVTVSGQGASAHVASPSGTSKPA
jgi:hypothetical protein